MSGLRDNFEADPVVAAEREARLHPDSGEAAQNCYRVWLRGQSLDTHLELTEALLIVGLRESGSNGARSQLLEAGSVVCPLLEALIDTLLRPFSARDAGLLPPRAMGAGLNERVDAAVRDQRSRWRSPEEMVSERERTSMREDAATSLIEICGELARRDGLAVAALRRLDRADLPGFRVTVAIGAARLDVDPSYRTKEEIADVLPDPLEPDVRTVERARRRRRLRHNRGPYFFSGW